MTKREQLARSATVAQRPRLVLGRGARTDPDILDVIERWVRHYNSPAAAIHVALEKRFPERCPNVKNVQAIVRAMRAMADPSERWQLADGPTEAGQAVLDALAAAGGFTDKRVTSVTRLEATWIHRIASARPDMPALEWWAYARLYAGRGDQGPTGDLDAQLAANESAIYESIDPTPHNQATADDVEASHLEQLRREGRITEDTDG